MSNNKKIRLSPGIQLLSAMEPDAPTVESLKDNIFGLLFNDDDGINHDALAGLLKAYNALLIEQAEENDVEVEFVSDADDYAAEKLYRRFCIRGWRDAVKREYPEAVASRDDDSVYEGCPWYEFEKRLAWPEQLIAEIGYVLGYKEGRRGIAMTKYVQQQEKAHGKDWWKNA